MKKVRAELTPIRVRVNPCVVKMNRKTSKKEWDERKVKNQEWVMGNRVKFGQDKSADEGELQ